MSNIYIPIDYSDLKDIIPQGEEIIYSTLASAKTATTTGSHIKTWDTHLLITNKGIAFVTTGKKKRSDDFERVYVPLYDMFVTGILGTLRVPPYCHLTLKRHADFETKETFKARSRAFQAIIAPVAINALKDQVRYLESVTGPEEKSSKKKAKKLLKEIPKLEKIEKKWSKWLK